MKKQLLLVIIACLGFSTVAKAQEKKERPNKAQTDMGKWFVQTDLGNYFNDSYLTSTGINYRGRGNSWNAGLSGGYFIKKNFAITTGFGYSENQFGYNTKSLSYKLGAKYYFKNNIFVEGNFGGTNINFNGPKPRLIGGQSFDPNKFETGINVGYAWFIGKYLSIEPSFNTQYEFDRNNSVLDLDINLGFSVHF